jgi:polyferredoxin
VPDRRLSLDVLSTRPARRLLRSPAFPLAFQLATLVALLALAVNGWGIGADASASELKTLRKTNLTTLVVWGLWWPGMIAAALVLGRAWCTVCPMELANRLGAALGKRLGLARLPLGRALRAGWGVVAAYLSLQLLVAGASIHRVPHYTALLLLALLGTALAAGLVFREPRSFCKGLCPAGALLSVYGRFTLVQLDVKDRAACERCTTKDCVAAANRDRLDARSCPSLLRPFARSASDGCVLCLQCAKVCPHGNVGFGHVPPGSPLRAPALLRPAEAAFVVVASGFVTHELAGEVKWLEALYHRVPETFGALLPGVSFGWLEAAWFLVLFPAALWLLVAGLARLAGQGGGARELLLAAATGAAPVVAVAHVAKALAKLSSWGGFLPLAVRDPRGLDTLGALDAGHRAAPGPMVALSTVGALTLAGVAALALWSWRRARRAGSTAAGRAGVAVTAALWTSVLVVWMRS